MLTMPENRQLPTAETNEQPPQENGQTAENGETKEAEIQELPTLAETAAAESSGVGWMLENELTADCQIERVNVVDEELFNDLIYMVPNWHRAPLANLISCINHLLTSAPLDETDAAWLMGGKKQLKEWSRCSKALNKHSPLDKDVRLHLRRKHPTDLKRLLKHHKNYAEPTTYWSTGQLLEELSSRFDHCLRYRIELNPSLSSQLSVFDEVMHSCQKKGLAVAGSLLDRRQESLQAEKMARRWNQPPGCWPLQTEIPRLRTDGIVLLTTAEAVDELLKLLLNYNAERELAFQGRHSSRLLYQLGPGLAISSTDHFGRWRISHAQLLAETLRLQQKLINEEQEPDFPAFRYRIDIAAEDAGFCRHNLAFSQN